MTGPLDLNLGIHADALALRARRLDLIASNIANAATPGYLARDLDFRSLLDGGTGGPLDLTDPGHMSGGTAPDNAPMYRLPVQTAPDGNTVELATEQAAFAENAVAYRASLAFLSGRIATLKSALRGE